jgi:hypothetical protein
MQLGQQVKSSESGARNGAGGDTAEQLEEMSSLGVPDVQQEPDE